MTGGIPTLAGGGGTYLGWGGTYLGQGGYLPWLGGGGVPTLAEVGTHPPGVDRQTPVKTVPSRRTTYAGGNNNTQA